MLHSILELKRPLILLDLETTAKEPATARIVQLGMRIYSPSGPVRDYHTLVNPGITMPKDAEKTHGITDAILTEGCARCHAPTDVHPTGKCDRFRPIPKFEDIAAGLLLGFQNTDFAGYHVHYDLEVLAAEFAREKLEFNYSNAYVLDALRIWQILEPRTLTDAVEHFGDGQKLSGAHDAMNDVIGTEVALIGQFTTHPKRAKLPKTMEELHALCFADRIDSAGKFKFIEGVPCFGFGKWNGKPMAKHFDYLAWMCKPEQTFSLETKRIATEALNGNLPKPKERMDDHI